METTVTGGAAVIDGLVAHGVSDVFGIPGTHNLELYRYLPASGLRHVVTRHEQGAAFAADGYARTIGRPGVVITTSGPGITNAITALATAHSDSIPVLAIAPGPPRGDEGRDVGGLHEMRDQLGALRAVCGTAIRVDTADDIPAALARIFEDFAVGRPRPAYLEIPVDVLEAPWVRVPQAPRHAPSPARPDAESVRRISEALRAAERPLVIAGGGARAATEQIRALGDLGIPVLTTANGKGILDEDHPSSLGASMRLRSAQRLAIEADVLLVVGSELADSDLWEGSICREGGDRWVCRIDIDPDQLQKNLAADLTVLADARTVLLEVVAAMGSTAEPTRAVPADLRAAIDAEAGPEASDWIDLQRALHAALPADTVIAGDASRVIYHGAMHFWPLGPAGRLLYPVGFSPLGYGLPAAIGAKIGAPGRPVVGLFGDGATMFSIQELLTAVEQRLPIPFVVVDNGGFGEIRAQMQDRGMQTLAVDLLGPDLVALARAMGAIGVSATTADEVAARAVEALTADRPTLIHHRIS